MLQLRMQLVPYLYTLFEECHRTGAPILRPLLFEYPDDPTTYTADDQFMVGDALLVAPITRPGVEHRHVYLPAGPWAHWWTGEVIEGPAHVLAHAPSGRPAIYARCNTPIPMWPAVQHTGEVPARSPGRCSWPRLGLRRPRTRTRATGTGPAVGELRRWSGRRAVASALALGGSGEFVPPAGSTFVEFAGGDRVGPRRPGRPW